MKLVIPLFGLDQLKNEEIQSHMAWEGEMSGFEL